MSMPLKNLSLIGLVFFTFQLQAQVEVKQDKAKYEFTVDKKIECTEVKSQDRTGTCWSFSTASFLESEMIRNGKGYHDLSEMYVVRNIYRDKAKNYVLRQGKANFSQGSLLHDLVRVVKQHGIVPEAAYSGKLEGEEKHDHGEMEAVLKGMLDAVLNRKRPSEKWPIAFDRVLDTYLGKTTEAFDYNGKSYTPKTFASEMALNADDYISITSYTHHPFYEQFILEIPDNYSNGSFYNLPIAELEAIVDNAIAKGYSVGWDGDVSEKGFSSRDGIAILPKDEKREDLFSKPGEETMVSQSLRQETFENYATTDDHLMHFTGISKDQKGTKYYVVKNSWGEVSDYKGFLHMSQAYFQLKTVSVMVHKDAVPEGIAKKLAL